LTTDGDGERAFSQAPIKAGKTSVSIKPRGGFVAVFK
jgi:alpha-glucosidase